MCHGKRSTKYFFWRQKQDSENNSDLLILFFNAQHCSLAKIIGIFESLTMDTKVLLSLVCTWYFCTIYNEACLHCSTKITHKLLIGVKHSKTSPGPRRFNCSPLRFNLSRKPVINAVGYGAQITKNGNMAPLLSAL